MARAIPPPDDVQFLQTSDRDDDVGRLRLLAVQNYASIIGVGSELAPAVERVAQANPKLSFAIVDGFADGPNVNSIAIDDGQAAFLSGVLAAAASAGRGVTVVVALGPQRRGGFERALRAGALRGGFTASPAFVETGPAGFAAAVNAAVRASPGAIVAAGTGPGAPAALAAAGERIATIAYGFKAPGTLANVPDALALATKVAVEEAQAQKLPSGRTVIGPRDGLTLSLDAGRFAKLPAGARSAYQTGSAAAASGSLWTGEALRNDL